MLRMVILFFSIVLANCSNLNHIMLPLRFQFQTDLQNIGLEKLKIIITAENKDEPIIIDSTDFFTCPAENDTCDRRGYYNEIPGYTQRVPMTSHSSYDYVLRASDGSAEMTILLIDTTDTLLFESFLIDTIKRHDFYLIYIGNEYSEKNSKIGDFITCFEGGVRDTPNHYGFPIKGTPKPNDSLFLIWME